VVRVRRRRGSSQAGQAIVLVAFMMIVLLTGIGLSIDASQSFYYNAAAERGAAAGALSGVIFMPNQFLPSQAISPGLDATDRATAEAVRNGHGIVAGNVAAAQVYDSSGALLPKQLKVTVTITVPLLFMRMFGIPNPTMSRSAIAEYLSPITLGQSGGQSGSTVAQLGTGADQYYFMREEGWSTDRQQGDAFTPNPAYEYGGTLSPPAQDVHQISGGNDVTDSNLPARGGYNYLVTLPAGGSIQVYNAAFAPDGSGGKAHNYCDNNLIIIFSCPARGSYYYHEEDSVNFGDRTTYSAMEYTLFKVNNNFIHSTDTELAQMKVLPIDASNWQSFPPQYLNLNTNTNVTQTYNPDWTPSNMKIYHSWVDVTNYSGAGDGGLVQRTITYGSAQLPAGTYRLRVDSLNYDGGMPPGNQMAHKGYSVRALDASGNLCTTACTIGAWADMCYYTPLSTTSTSAFKIPIFQLPAAYAARVISVDVFDPGDISGGGNVDINILDPNLNVVTATSAVKVGVYDLGVDRASNPASPANLVQTSNTATFRATTNGSALYNGHWVELQVPIPASYSPTGTNAANYTYYLQYATSSTVTATDTVTLAVGLAGAPSHLLVG
jgi:hypothetical protein